MGDETLFRPPRRAHEPKGPEGKKLIGVWATQQEQEVIKQMAHDDGHANVADFFRALLLEHYTQGHG